MEGDSGIVARTYGTCVLLERATEKVDDMRQSSIIDSSDHHRPDQALESRLTSRFLVSEAVAAAAANTVAAFEKSTTTIAP